MKVLTTEKAISTYNFLVEEGRVVAAALIPPETVNIMDIDVVETKERCKFLAISTLGLTNFCLQVPKIAVTSRPRLDGWRHQRTTITPNLPSITFLSCLNNPFSDLNTMGIYHIFIVSKSGGLIFNYDHKVFYNASVMPILEMHCLGKVPETEHEKTYSYPLDIQLKFENKRVQVKSGYE